MRFIIDFCGLYHEEVRQAEENETAAEHCEDPKEKSQLRQWGDLHRSRARILMLALQEYLWK
ncbi:MAG: hypothetical protein ABSC42_05555 [Tepidisphaeraceae bacterium]